MSDNGENSKRVTFLNDNIWNVNALGPDGNASNNTITLSNLCFSGITGPLLNYTGNNTRLYLDNCLFSCTDPINPTIFVGCTGLTGFIYLSETEVSSSGKADTISVTQGNFGNIQM